MALSSFQGPIVSKLYLSDTNQSCDPSGTHYNSFWLSVSELDYFGFN